MWLLSLFLVLFTLAFFWLAILPEYGKDAAFFWFETLSLSIGFFGAMRIFLETCPHYSAQKKKAKKVNKEAELKSMLKEKMKGISCWR